MVVGVANAAGPGDSHMIIIVYKNDVMTYK